MTEAVPIEKAVAQRPFRVVTHKSALVATFAPFGAEQDLGGNVDPDTAGHTLWWASPDWLAQVLAAGVKLPQLLSPTPGFFAGLDRRWLQRQVGHLRKGDVSGFYAKHASMAVDHPQVVVSTGTDRSELLPPVYASAELISTGQFPPGYDRLDDQVALQLEEPLPCVVEARYWIAHNEVTAACAYRIGDVGWDAALFLEMLFNQEARELLQIADPFAADFAAEVVGPPGYVVDIGVTMDGTATVLRAWPSWAADPLSASPVGVFRSVLAAHDFDLDFATNDVWRWTPDLRIYDRSRLIRPTEEETDV